MSADPSTEPPPSAAGRALDAAIHTLNSAGTLLIVLLALLVNSDVFGRALLNNPLPGVPEIAGLAIVVIVFLQVPYCLRHSHLTRSDAFLCKLFQSRPAAAVAVDAAYSLVGAIVFAVIAFAAWRLTQKAWTGNEYEGAAGVFTIPVWPVKAAVVVGATLMAVQYLRKVAIAVAAIRRRDWRAVGSFNGGEL